MHNPVKTHFLEDPVLNPGLPIKEGCSYSKTQNNFFAICNLFSELKTPFEKMIARKNLGVDGISLDELIDLLIEIGLLDQYGKPILNKDKLMEILKELGLIDENGDVVFNEEKLKELLIKLGVLDENGEINAKIVKFDSPDNSSFKTALLNYGEDNKFNVDNALNAIADYIWYVTPSVTLTTGLTVFDYSVGSSVPDFWMTPGASNSASNLNLKNIKYTYFDQSILKNNDSAITKSLLIEDLPQYKIGYEIKDGIITEPRTFNWVISGKAIDKDGKEISVSSSKSINFYWRYLIGVLPQNQINIQNIVDFILQKKSDKSVQTGFFKNSMSTSLSKKLDTKNSSEKFTYLIVLPYKLNSSAEILDTGALNAPLVANFKSSEKTINILENGLTHTYYYYTYYPSEGVTNTANITFNKLV